MLLFQIDRALHQRLRMGIDCPDVRKLRSRNAQKRMIDLQDLFAHDVIFIFFQKIIDVVHLMMPVMSGYEAARVIRGMDREDAKAVPIIALSANTFEEDIALAKDAGMNEHLAKPVDIKKMFRAMSRLRRWQT